MRTLLLPLALLAAVPALAEDKAEDPAPSQIVAAAPLADWVGIAPSDLLVMDLAPGTNGKARRVVIQLMPKPFSQGWIGNIRKLAAAHWWDGLAVTRVQDNYVAQWGDPDGEDKAKARTLYDTACGAGELTGCVNGGALYLNGEGGPADKVKARMYFEKACDQKNADGCFNLGLVYAKGIEVPVDYDKAVALLKKGCDAGSKKSCEVAQQIQDDLAKQKEEASKPKGKGKPGKK